MRRIDVDLLHSFCPVFFVIFPICYIVTNWQSTFDALSLLFWALLWYVHARKYEMIFMIIDVHFPETDVIVNHTEIYFTS